MPEDDDQLVRFRQGLDQIGMMLADLAPVLGQLRSALVASGFSPEEAMILVSQQMERMLRPR